jgi:hypothetical protein
METLTASQKKALDRSRLKPVYLIEITLQGAGAPILYFSDRNITIGSQIYENYLSDLSGLGEEIERATSESLNPDVSLRFRNDRYKTYGYLIEIGDIYPFDGAGIIIKEVYLDDNNTTSDVRIIFKGALDEPQDIDLLSFECSVSAMPFIKDQQWKQSIITKAVYVNADPDDLNKHQNIIYGACQQVRCHAIKAGAVDALTAAITATSPGNSGTLVLSDASEYPSSGAFTIQTDDEKIRIASRSGNTLTLTSSGARGYGSTTPAAHNQGAAVFEVLTEYIYLLAGHAVKAINDVYVDEIRQISGVTKYTGQSGNEHPSYPGKAIITFSVKPKITKQVNLTADKTGSVSDNIDFTSAGNNQTIYPDSVTGETNPGNIYDGNETTAGTAYVTWGGGYGFWTISFPSTNYGAITTQYLWVKVLNSYGVGNLSWDITQSGWSPTIVNPSGWIRFQKSGGNWGDTLNLRATVANSGDNASVYVYEIKKEVIYTPSLSKTGSANNGTLAISLAGNSSADVVIGSSVNCDVDGYRDDGSGTYTGSANALIERPDHVLKHFIDILYGFTLTDIDSSSFSAAGALYAAAISGGYKFAFVINSEISPSKFLSELAFQCRSNLKYDKGLWKLLYLPDTAPAAAKTISKTNLAGKFAKFKFNRSANIDITNDLTAKFKKNYGGIKYDESEWLGTSTASDSTSQGKYGVRAKTYEFPAIRLQAMADHVLAFILLQRKNPLLIIDFLVFWEYLDLERGDTLDISNPLYNGKKFYIERVGRPDKGKVEITGLEWP